MSKLKSYNYTKDYSISTYTDEQKVAIDNLVEFIRDKNGPIDFTLEGPGGTGKTTIVKDVLKFAAISGKKCVTAPTHKAVRVVSKLSGLTGKTIHKLLGLRPNILLDNFNPNSPMFASMGVVTMGDYSVVIIDEASMINSHLYDKIIQTAKRCKTKVIFIGDECQAPPVGESLSKVFKSERKISLNLIMRQHEDNKLIPILNALRDDIKYNSSYSLALLRKFNETISETGGYYKQNIERFKSSMYTYFNSEDFEKNINFCRTTCFTNNAVSDWNFRIRQSLFPDIEYILCKDDLLMSYNTIVDMISPDKVIEVMVNSEEYIIHDFNHYINDSGIKGFLVSLQAVNTGQITPSMFIVDHKHQKSIDIYADIVSSYITKAYNANNSVDRKLAWQEYYQYRNKNLIMVDLYRKNGSLLTSKDLSYGFALTVHKTQGSTYDNIFVDVNNIIYNKFGAPVRDIKLRNRLLYVALSRPRNIAFMHINL